MRGREIFITGGTGFIGRNLIPALLARGHNVRALVRMGSEWKLPFGCTLIRGSPFDRMSFIEHVHAGDTFIHLVGATHPNPSKPEQFRRVDLLSIRTSVVVAQERRVDHLIYLSVAQPAPIMKAYLEARSEGETLIRSSGIPTTIVRPWYVLGPGRRWPLVLLPVYWVMRRIPAARATAARLGLVTVRELVTILVEAVERPPERARIVTVPDIKSGHLPEPSAS